MKRNFRQIIYFFFFILIKGIAAATALFMAFFFFSTTHTLIQEAWKHKLYSPLTDYYAISISPSIDFDRENMQKLNHALAQFFLKTNNSQSLLLHADTQIRLCDEGFITREELKDENFAITINEAYLANYPIYDIDGNPVTIQGNKSENYLLIPETYRLQEQKLKNYYEENNTFLKYYIDDLKTIQNELDTKNGQAINDLISESRDYRDNLDEHNNSIIQRSYSIFCDIIDESGAIATIATILATNGVSIKNIGIIHNREHEEGVLKISFYDEVSANKAIEQLERHRYKVFKR